MLGCFFVLVSYQNLSVLHRYQLEVSILPSVCREWRRSFYSNNIWGRFGRLLAQSNILSRKYSEVGGKGGRVLMIISFDVVIIWRVDVDAFWSTCACKFLGAIFFTFRSGSKAAIR